MAERLLGFEECKPGIFAWVLVCVHCKMPIKGFGTGLIARKNGYEEPEFFAVHKGACDRAYTAGTHYPWREIHDIINDLVMVTRSGDGESTRHV
jgi:hypothetical protein